MPKPAKIQPNAAIPTFLLYEDGLIGPQADSQFVHIETISARAGLHNWEIRPHRHGALHQFLLLLRGHGRFDNEGDVEALSAPTLVVVPATLVHGFSFSDDAEGFVLTVSFPGKALRLPLLGDAEEALVRAVFEFAASDLPWRRLGRARAIAACLELTLVILARRVALADSAAPSPDRQVLQRFQALVNQHAADGWSIAQYARGLGVSVGQLNRICALVAGRAPLRLVHDRLLSEAKQSLVYTAMTIQEIGFSLGFADPAYFTRFFTQREGCSPSQFRRRAADGRGRALSEPTNLA